MLSLPQVTVLPNGAKIATLESRESASVAIGFFVAAGARCEPAAVSGHSHFLEHMLFKGSAKRAAHRILQDIEGRGGRTNASTGNESTYYYASMPEDSAALGLDVIGDAYLHPTLAPADVEKERGVIMEELKMYRDSPDDYVSDLAQSALWKNHPLGTPIIGSPKTLEDTTAESLRGYHASRYHAGSTVIAAAGAVSHEKFVAMATPYALALPASGDRGFKKATANTPIVPLIVDRRETEQVNAVLGYRIDFGDSDERRYALRVLNVLLGENMSSRLFRSVREKHGMAYAVASSGTLFTETGGFQIYAGFDRKRSAKGLELCAAEIKRILNETPGKAEFARAIRYITGGLKMSYETTISRMWFAGMGTLKDKKETPEETIEKFTRVTPEQVRALAGEIFKPEKRILALVMPRDGVDSPEKHLEAASC